MEVFFSFAYIALINAPKNDQLSPAFTQEQLKYVIAT